MIQLAILVMLVVGARAFGGAPANSGRRTWNGHSARCLVAWLVAGPVGIVCVVAIAHGARHPVTIGLAVASTLVLFPWPITRGLLIPAGLVRSAFWLARLADWTWGPDPLGGAAVAAVLAATHGLRPATTRAGRLWRRVVNRPGDLAWARERVQRLDLLGAAGVTAVALLADLDDATRADAVLQALDHFDPEVVPAAAARLVAERRLSRPWPTKTRRVALLALPHHGSPTVRLVQALVRRDVDNTLSARLACVGWWLAAPRKARTWPLLRGRQRVLPAVEATPPASTTTAASTASPPTDADDALVVAARRHVELSSRPDDGLAVELDDVVGLAALWQAGLPRAIGWLSRRAPVLKVDVDEAGHALQETILGALRQHVEPLDLSAVETGTLPPVLRTVVARVRSERMDALEIAVAAWRSRLESAVDRAPVDELTEWVALRSLQDAVARTGSDGRYLAWEASQWVACELAVRLWNVRHEHRLANAIFRSLLNEARAVGDARAEETQLANVACGP